MNDPHVVALHYSISSGLSEAIYVSPPPVTVQQPDFELQLRDGLGVAKMLNHYTTTAEARSVVDPFVKAWEIHSVLESGGVSEIGFRFVKSEIIDRSPPSAGYRLSPETGNLAIDGPAVTLRVTRSAYPPPAPFSMNADVETLWFRYSLYKEGRDTLAGMGYFCLTYVESITVASDLNISSNILAKLRRLTSGVGDATTARKWSMTLDQRHHTAREVAWIDAAIRALIRRVGEHAAEVPLRQLTMADLPPLTP